MDREKVVVGIPMGQVPKREDQQFPPLIAKEALQTLVAAWEGDHLEVCKHAGIFGFLLGRRLVR